MVKHTQTIRWQQPTRCLSVFDYFVGLAFNEFNKTSKFVFLNMGHQQDHPKIFYKSGNIFIDINSHKWTRLKVSMTKNLNNLK